MQIGAQSKEKTWAGKVAAISACMFYTFPSNREIFRNCTKETIKNFYITVKIIKSKNNTSNITEAGRRAWVEKKKGLPFENSLLCFAFFKRGKRHWAYEVIDIYTHTYSQFPASKWSGFDYY